MLTHTVDEKSGIVEIVIDGQVDPADYDAAITAIDAMIERHGTVKLLEVLKYIAWVDPTIWWKDTIWGPTRTRDFGSCAVVTDKGGGGHFARAIGAHMHAAVRVLQCDSFKEARTLSQGRHKTT